MDFAKRPLHFFLLLHEVPMEVSGGPGQNPARWWPAGSDGGVEENEGSECYLGVCSVRVGNAEGGGAA